MPVTVSAPVLSKVASLDSVLVAKPVPSPIRSSVSPTATSDGSPVELASLTFTVLAAMCANFALVIPSSVTLTVRVCPVAEVSNAAPPATVRDCELRSTAIVPESDTRSKS